MKFGIFGAQRTVCAKEVFVRKVSTVLDVLYIYFHLLS